MALIGVEPTEDLCRERADELARELGVPVLLSPTRPGPGVKLLVSPSALFLAFVDTKRGKPFAVDFLSSVWRARWQQGLAKNHIFRRALGAQETPMRVIDATAGFGQDAAMMASMGCRVLAIEKSPVVSAVLQDGLLRARSEDEGLRASLDLVRVVQADSFEYLSQLEETDFPDVIYIDPMFEKPKKTAKSPKEMQLLQELLPSAQEGEVERLLEMALTKTRSRVVVKQPLKARAIRANPHHVYKGQSIRYDVYKGLESRSSSAGLV